MNPLAVDCNSKKIIGRLYKEVNEKVISDKMIELSELNTHIINFFDNIESELPYNLTYDMNLDLLGLLKLYRFSIDSNPESFLEKLIDYIRVMSSVAGIRIFFFTDLRKWLDEEECRQLYEYVLYNKILLILIENSESTKLLEEKVLILDKDLCMITV